MEKTNEVRGRELALAPLADVDPEAVNTAADRRHVTRRRGLACLPGAAVLERDPPGVTGLE